MLQPELKMRRDKIRVLMAQQNIEAALITCNVNLLYTYLPYRQRIPLLTSPLTGFIIHQTPQQYHRRTCISHP